jgi:hypothetical protein
LAYNFHQYDQRITVHLDGANDGAVTEVFGKMLQSAAGLADVKRYRTTIAPDNPQASKVLWLVTARDDLDPFGLQTTIIHMTRELFQTGGVLPAAEEGYAYPLAEIAMLRGLRAGDATSRKIHFVIDRELARDREMSGW